VWEEFDCSQPGVRPLGERRRIFRVNFNPQGDFTTALDLKKFTFKATVLDIIDGACCLFVKSFRR
jgi:hypothetical protein